MSDEFTVKPMMDRLKEIVNGDSTTDTKKTLAVAFCHSMADAIYAGRSRYVEEMGEQVVVPIRDFELMGQAKFGQDCSLCRKRIQAGEAVWFWRRNRTVERTVAFHDDCFDVLRGRAPKPSLFDPSAGGVTAGSFERDGFR